MIILAALLTAQTKRLGGIDHRYLHHLITTKNFQYQTVSYARKTLPYYQTDKDVEKAGRAASQIIAKLDAKSSVEAIRAAIAVAYTAKERFMSREWRYKFSDQFDQYFRNNQGKTALLSRQDVCALILIDLELVSTAYVKSLRPILDGFESMNRRDFDCPEVSLAFLKIANFGILDGEKWKYERELWALQVCEQKPAIDAMAIGIRSFRQAAYGIRVRDTKKIDQGIAILQNAKDYSKLIEFQKGLSDSIAYLLNQKTLLQKRIEREKKSGGKA